MVMVKVGIGRWRINKMTWILTKHEQKVTFSWFIVTAANPRLTELKRFTLQAGDDFHKILCQNNADRI